MQVKTGPAPGADGEDKVLILGGGLAGLICATELHARKIPFLLLERAAEPGGRVRTDSVDGFLLDHGFQILLTGYPWVSRYLDLEALDFRAVKSGALIWTGEEFFRLVDPIRHPADLNSALTTPVISWGDRLRITSLAARLYPQSGEALLGTGAEETTAEYLAQTKFSEKALRSFLRPFFGGVLLERELNTAANYFRFLFRVFGTGAAGVPGEGMGAIARQLAAKLPSASLRYGAEVVRREGRELTLADGERLGGRALVCAGDQESARALNIKEAPKRPWHASLTVYFTAAASPIKENLLALNGSGEGYVNSLLVMSDVAPHYAPEGQALLSVSLLGLDISRAEEAGTIARRELKEWYGPVVEEWRELRTVVIPHALPAYGPGCAPFLSSKTSEEGVFLAGDLLTIPSQEGAATAGRLAAEAVDEYLRSS